MHFREEPRFSLRFDCSTIFHNAPARLYRDAVRLQHKSLRNANSKGLIHCVAPAADEGRKTNYLKEVLLGFGNPELYSIRTAHDVGFQVGDTVRATI